MSLLVTRTIHSKKDKPYLLLFNKFSISKAFLQFNEYLKEGGTILAVIVNKTEGRYVVASRAIVEDYRLWNTEGMGLYFYSNCKGSEKTRMVTSIANELIYEQNMSVKFATSVQIINEIKASWDKEEGMSEHQLLDDLAKAEVLITDDFGMETVRDWIAEKIYQMRC